jgi:uncharacterized protein (TIGR02588 family)
MHSIYYRTSFKRHAFR